MPHTIESCWGCHQVVHTTTGQVMATVEVNRMDNGEYSQGTPAELAAKDVANHLRQALDEVFKAKEK